MKKRSTYSLSSVLPLIANLFVDYPVEVDDLPVRPVKRGCTLPPLWSITNNGTIQQTSEIRLDSSLPFFQETKFEKA